jgi:NAD(P)-dependent dehydrogenase (short-subunit alcohol dehydrogenase family)
VGIEGKRIVVTGGASGLGEAAVRVFIREGALVASLDIQDDAGRDIVTKANDEGPGHATYHHCDVRDGENVRSAVKQAVDVLGGLDVNLKGTFLTNQAAFRYLRRAAVG